MDTSTLKYFITVAQTQHMTRAAKQLNITQPSLSAAIRRLESDIGYQLFDRTKRGIQLNDYGKIFLKGLVQTEDIMNSCFAEMEGLKKASVSFVRMACSNSSTNSQLIDLLLSQGVSLKVNNIPEDWERALMDKTCDLVITMGCLHRPGIEHTALRLQRLVVLASRDHPLAPAENVTVEELNRYPFCSTDAPYSLINVVKEQIPSCDFHPRITFLGRNSGDMLKAIRSGKCIGLMVKRNLSDMDGLAVLPVENFDIALPIYLYWRKSDTQDTTLASMRQSIVSFYQMLPKD